MSEFQAVATLAELELLDQDDILAGYRAGFDGVPEPGSDKSRAYWHGWRNARVDRGLAQSDRAQQLLAQEYVRQQKNAK
jgi:hypothetical protein